MNQQVIGCKWQFQVDNEFIPIPSRPRWRQEIELPEYAATNVRKACKRYLHRNREQQWKEFAFFLFVLRIGIWRW